MEESILTKADHTLRTRYPNQSMTPRDMDQVAQHKYTPVVRPLVDFAVDITP